MDPHKCLLEQVLRQLVIPDSAAKERAQLPAQRLPGVLS